MLLMAFLLQHLLDFKHNLALMSALLAVVNTFSMV